MGQRELARRHVLQELVVLVDDLHRYRIAVGG
jgi:hypothetical protein